MKAKLNKLEICATILKHKINQEIEFLNLGLSAIENVRIYEQDLNLDSGYYLLIEMDWDIKLKDVVGYELFDTDTGKNYIVHSFMEKIRKIIAIAKG